MWESCRSVEEPRPLNDSGKASEICWKRLESQSVIDSFSTCPESAEDERFDAIRAGKSIPDNPAGNPALHGPFTIDERFWICSIDAVEYVFPPTSHVMIDGLFIFSSHLSALTSVRTSVGSRHGWSTCFDAEPSRWF